MNDSGISTPLLWLGTATIVLVVVATGASAQASSPRDPGSSPSSPPVIGYDDSGINPYHEEFRAPGWTAHPSTYIQGYPETAKPLNLTLDADSFDEAWDADEDIWNSVEIDQLYYIPGTRIVGAIEVNRESGGPNTPIYDDGRNAGHGTLVASAGSGNTLGTAPNSAIVMLSGTTNGGWFIDHPWIDLVSVSKDSLGGAGIPQTAQPSYDITTQGRSVFNAGGNGLGINTFGSGAGPPWTVTVGLYEPASTGLPGNRACAQCERPVEVLGRSGVPVAKTDSLNGTREGTGTSTATPRVAGHAAQLVDQARERLDDVSKPSLGDDSAYAQATPTTPLPTQGPLTDGAFNRSDLERLVRQASIPVPWAFPNTSLILEDERLPANDLAQPDQARYTWQGYGVHNATANRHATEILLGDQPWPDRPVDDRWHTFWEDTRAAYWHTTFCQYEDFQENYNGNCWTDPTLGLTTTARELVLSVSSSPT